MLLRTNVSWSGFLQDGGEECVAMHLEFELGPKATAGITCDQQKDSVGGKEKNMLMLVMMMMMRVALLCLHHQKVPAVIFNTPEKLGKSNLKGVHV